MRVETGHHLQIVGGPRGGRDAARLEHDADARAQLRGVLDRIEPEHTNDARVGAAIALAHLDRRGLTGPVRPEYGCDLATRGTHRQAGHCGGPTITLD